MRAINALLPPLMLFSSDVDIQRGFLVGFSCKKIDFTICVFILDESKPTVVSTVSLNF
jgi:hypothetical protein